VSLFDKTVAAIEMNPVVIAVMGVTGVGKSTLIRTITGRDDIVVGHDLTSGK
jgi:putative ribosome biogenesis GTPase RsgA